MANISSAQRVAAILFDGKITPQEAVELYQIVQQEENEFKIQTKDSWDFYRSVGIRDPFIERVNTKLMLWNSPYHLRDIVFAKDKRDGTVQKYLDHAVPTLSQNRTDVTFEPAATIPDDNIWIGFRLATKSDCSGSIFQNLFFVKSPPSEQDVKIEERYVSGCPD